MLRPETKAMLDDIAIVPEVHADLGAEWQVQHIKRHVEAFLEAFQRVHKEPLHDGRVAPCVTK